MAQPSPDTDTITIPLSEYKRLVKDSDKLEALHAGGVDNWQWYSESLEDFWKQYENEE